METIGRPRSAPNKQSKLARTLSRVISLRAATKIASNNGICKLKPRAKVTKEEHDFEKMEDLKAKNRAVMEALLAKLFAGITSIKAAYAELQMAQNPYNNEAIQVADLAVVDELKAISELKRSFLKKQLDLSPQVTLMLAEIQEQQGLMKTYEITIKKLESEAEHKGTAIPSLKTQLEELVSSNQCLESKLKASGPLSIFDNLRLSNLSPTHFVQFQQQTLRSIRNLVKLMVREMESASWDLDTAIKFIEPEAEFSKQSHRCFAFESYVSKTMLEGFHNPNFGLPSDSFSPNHKTHHLFFEEFNKLKSVNPKSFLAQNQNQNSSFCKFTRAKYLQLVHAKMECSLFGNLNQRKLVNSGEVPDTPFFAAFAEMSMRVWLLHCLAFSFGQQVSIFQVKKSCRFSEVYMESVTVNDSDTGFSVIFTVVPGFKIGKAVYQSLVYLSPAN